MTKTKLKFTDTFITIAIAILLCICVFLALDINASAAGEHIHPVCGASCSDHDLDGKSDGHTNITWTDLNAFIASYDPDNIWYGKYRLPEGNYYLSASITSEYGFHVEEGASVNICLNGKKLAITTAEKSIIQMYAGILSLCDCSPNTQNSFTSPIDGSTVTVSGGLITGANSYSAIYLNNDAYSFNMYGGNISGNSRNDYSAGGVDARCDFNMYGGSISYNSASSGGGISVDKTFNMYGGKISHNAAVGQSSGGGIYVTYAEAKINIYNGEISYNSADKGGGIYASSGEITIHNGKIINNTATESGGGIATQRAKITMLGGQISYNSVTDGDDLTIPRDGGGGIHSFRSVLSIMGGEISYNSSNLYGGGLVIHDAESSTIYSDSLIESGIINGVIKNNSAKYGGGIYVSGSQFYIISNTTIKDNEASEEGGGIYLEEDHMDNQYTYLMLQDNSLISGNSAKRGGGAYVQVKDSNFEVTNSTITNNTATDKGGAVYVNNGASLAFGGVTVINNNYVSNNQNNVYVCENGKIINFAIKDNSQNYIMPTEGAVVHFTTEKTPMVISNRNFDYYEQFNDDYTKYLVNDDGKVVKFVGEGSEQQVVVLEHRYIDGVEYFPVGNASDLKNLSNGNYYLYNDITLDEAMTVSSEVKLYFDGKTITGDVNIAAGGVLTAEGENGAINGTLTSNGMFANEVKQLEISSPASGNVSCSFHNYSDPTCTLPSTCKVCESTTGDALGHLDTNTDHTCDRNCGNTNMGDHIDEDLDHACDYGCTTTIDECKDEDLDHACDYGCTLVFGDCVDATDDNDHVCDYGCTKVLEACNDASGDSNHACDICGADNITSHSYNDATCMRPATCPECLGTTGDELGHIDEDTNHVCDRSCGKADMGMDKHIDENLDHACDYGCTSRFGECQDNDRDHACDHGCGKAYGECADSDTDNDHICDYGCEKVFEACADADNDSDHNCDVCGKADISEHIDADTNHSCDNNCSTPFGECKDSDDADLVCDYGCGKSFDDATTDENNNTNSNTSNQNGSNEQSNSSNNSGEGDESDNGGCGSALSSYAAIIAVFMALISVTSLHLLAKKRSKD